MSQAINVLFKAIDQSLDNGPLAKGAAAACLVNGLTYTDDKFAIQPVSLIDIGQYLKENRVTYTGKLFRQLGYGPKIAWFEVTGILPTNVEVDVSKMIRKQYITAQVQSILLDLYGAAHLHEQGKYSHAGCKSSIGDDANSTSSQADVDDFISACSTTSNNVRLSRMCHVVQST